MDHQTGKIHGRPGQKVNSKCLFQYQDTVLHKNDKANSNIKTENNSVSNSSASL